MKKIKELFDKYRELIMYVIIGGCTTLVNWIVYALLTAAGAGMTVSNGAAWVCAVIFAFFANKLLVFESRSFAPGTVIKEAVKFVGSRVLTGLIEIFLPSLLFKAGLDMDILGIEGAAAKLTVSVIVIVLNYVFGKLVVFTKKDR
ncbi:MAG: GtrA family protein [Oscillospiraceae bacterium]